MKTSFMKINLVLAALLAGSVMALGQSNKPPGANDYSQFSTFITQRNIFDPSRQPHYVSSTHHTTTHRPTHSTGAPSIQLVGMMSYDKGLFAFFNSNNSESKKALQVSDKIAGYTITLITPNTVSLASADNKDQLVMKIGDGFQQENDKWVYVKEGDVLPIGSTSSSSHSAGTDTSDTTPSTPASASEPNDALKRMMQRREKENQ